MIYNDRPIIDHFRRLNDTTIAGVMDTDLFPPEMGLFYFTLTKL
jgi:hypothetical protein